MTNRTVFSKLVAAVTIVALQLLLFPAFGEVRPGSISGTVLSASDQAPLAGARVHVGNPKTGEIFSSETTSADGGFQVASLPAANYQLGVEANGGLYLVHPPVSLEAGQRRTVQLAVADPAPPPEEAEEDSTKGKKPTIWSNPVTATLILLGAAIILGWAIDDLIDDKRVTSPS